MKIAEMTRWMAAFAPPELAESWDNTGFLCGDESRECRRVMTCLTVTPESAAEAVAQRADLVIAHHPLPFRPLTRLTEGATTESLIRTFIKNDVALYCPHTAFDSAKEGINQQLAEALGLCSILPLEPCARCAEGGTGRFGEYGQEMPLSEFLRRVKNLFGLPYVQYVGTLDQPVRRVAIGCGAAGEFLEHARKLRCDTFLTGEANFHTGLEARARGIAMVLMTHFAGERYACVRLAEIIRERVPALEAVWACASESEPLNTYFEEK